MHEYELRVHYSAASMYKDDERWRKIADNVRRFRPAKRMSLSSIHDTSNELDESSQSLPQMLLDDEARAHEEVQALPALPSEEHDEAQSTHINRKRANGCEPEQDRTTNKRTRTSAFSRTKQGINPAFKNPIAAYLRTSKGQEITPRPRTAPEAKVLVPATTSPRPQRSVSDSHLEPRPQFPNWDATDLVAETSFLEESQSCSDSLEVRPLHLPSTSFSSSIPGVNRFPGNQEHLAREAHNRFGLPGTQLPLEDSQPIVIRLSQTSIQDSEVLYGTLKPSTKPNVQSATNTDMGSKAEGSRKDPSSADANEHEPSSTTDHNSSPSEEELDDSSPLASRSIRTRLPQAETLVEPQTPKRAITRREVLGPVSSPAFAPTVNNDDVEPASQTTPLQTSFNMIRSLPQRVECEVEDSNFKNQHSSNIPPYLGQLGQQHNLVDHFRPVQAPITLPNNKRGYWKLLIRISDTNNVVISRRSPMTESQWSDQRFRLRQDGTLQRNATIKERDVVLHEMTYPPKEPDKHVLWTCDEFVTFWKYVQKTIERGRAGYDSRATIQKLEEFKQELLLDVRIWCFSEALSHIWLMLFGLSHGLSADLPMQWKMAGKDVTITMSGHLKHQGDLGRWIEEQSGLEGSWGIEVN